MKDSPKTGHSHEVSYTVAPSHTIDFAQDDLPAVLRVDPHVMQTLDISREKAYQLANTKGFPSVRIGKRILVPKTQFLRWLEDQANS